MRDLDTESACGRANGASASNASLHFINADASPLERALRLARLEWRCRRGRGGGAMRNKDETQGAAHAGQKIYSQCTTPPTIMPARGEHSRPRWRAADGHCRALLTATTPTAARCHRCRRKAGSAAAGATQAECISPKNSAIHAAGTITEKPSSAAAAGLEHEPAPVHQPRRAASERHRRPLSQLRRLERCRADTRAVCLK